MLHNNLEEPLMVDVPVRKEIEPEKHLISQKNRGGLMQGALGVIGFGIIALFVKSSQNCAADLRCVDKLLAQLPENYRTATLIVCGGVEVAFTSALCAMDAIPEYLNYINQFSGITKFIKGGGVLLAASAATSEKIFVAIKAYPTLSEALSAPATYITLISAYPMNLYGVLNIVTKDWSYLISKINQWRGRYRGKLIEGDEFYPLLCQEYHAFQKRTKDQWAACVPRIKNIVPDSKQDPLRLLHRLSLETKLANPESYSFLKTTAYHVVKTASLFACFGALTPVLMNTYHFLNDSLAKDNHSTEIAIGLGMLSGLIGLPHIRTVIKKTMHGTARLFDWSLSQDVEFQLNPTITMTSWGLNIPMAYFSYAVYKSAALNNFSGDYQQPMVEIAGYSISYVHLVFGFKFFSSLLERFAKNYWYEVKKVVEKVADMTLEQFDDFIQGLEIEDYEIFQIDKRLYRQERDSELSSVSRSRSRSVSDVVLETDEVVLEIHDDEPQAVLSEVKAKVAPPAEVSDVAPKERWAHQLCRWFCGNTVVSDVDNDPELQNAKKYGAGRR